MNSSEKLTRRDSRLFGELAEKFLRQGTAVRFRAEGASMTPNLQDDEMVTITPVDSFAVRRGNILLTRDGAQFKAHRVVKVHAMEDRIETRGDAGRTNQSTCAADILGRVSFSENQASGKQTAHDSRLSFWRANFRRMMHRVRAAVAVRVRNPLSLGAFALAASTCMLLAPAPVAAQADLRRRPRECSRGGGAGRSGFDPDGFDLGGFTLGHHHVYRNHHEQWAERGKQCGFVPADSPEHYVQCDHVPDRLDGCRARFRWHRIGDVHRHRVVRQWCGGQFQLCGQRHRRGGFRDDDSKYGGRDFIDCGSHAVE